VRARGGRRSRASSGEQFCLRSPMVCSIVLAAAAAATLACLSAAAAATGDLLPSSSETPLSFGDGYTQLFGDSNLALHGGGKTVHISLDERTGGSARRFMLVSRPIDAQSMPSRAPCFLLSVREPHRRLLCSAPLRCVQAPGSRRRPRTSTGTSAPASSCPPTTPPASSSPSTYVTNQPTQPPMLRFFCFMTNPNKKNADVQRGRVRADARRA
jgi:hypothetical protein